jgi:hypothetical protein
MRVDVPLRLLEWGVGLLRTDRIEWGQAMLGELDRIEGRSARWRFALGCVAGVLVRPPDGAVRAMAALAAVALGGAVVICFGFVHFGLATNPWDWIWLAITAALLMSFVVAAGVLLRRRSVAGPGLLGGLFVAIAWVACSRLTLLGLSDPIHQIGRLSVPLLLIAVPLIVGTLGAWQSGSVDAGRRIARLAGISAGLALFFVSTIAVLATDGGPRDPGVSVAGGVSEGIFIAAMLSLVFLPLSTAMIGWIAVTATDRFRSGRLARRNDEDTSAQAVAGRVVVRAKSRSAGPLLLRAAVVVVVLMAAALLFLAR